MKGFLGGLLVMGAVLLSAGAVLWALYPAAPDRRAVLASAGVALAVQVVSLGVMRLASRENVIAAWGVGALLRFAAFVVYVFVIAGALALPRGAAMISLAVFLFASTVVEPLFLRK